MVYTLLDWILTKNKPNYDYLEKVKFLPTFFYLKLTWKYGFEKNAFKVLVSPLARVR